MRHQDMEFVGTTFTHAYANKLVIGFYCKLGHVVDHGNRFVIIDLFKRWTATCDVSVPDWST